jgi:hypothetical protein
MKLGSGILKTAIQNLSDENFHFYNSLVLTDDLAFEQTHFWITPPNIPRIYNHDAASDDNDDLLLQHRSNLQNNELLKIAILIATNTCTKETSHAIIDSGASCCVTPYIEDFINQPTPIQNTTLKGISGGLTSLGRGTVQLKIHQENKENIILVIHNVIYAPDCPIRLISPQQLHRQSKAKGHDNSCFTTEETTATLYHGGDTFTCAYHPKTKIPTLSCITDSKTQKTHIPTTSTLAQQPSNKGRKRVICHDDKQQYTPAAYHSNLNTSQQELLRLHETYAHADMREIQQQIKNCEIKAHRQVATCQIPKCILCLESKGKKRSHKQHCGSITRTITKDENHPGSNTSIDHVDAANVPGYTWQHKGRPTLNKYNNLMIFVDHKTCMVYPSFQESKTASEACRSKCDYEKFAKRYNVTIDSYHADMAHSDLKHFKNQLKTKTRNSTSVALMLNGKTALLNVPTEHYVQQHDQC